MRSSNVFVLSSPFLILRSRFLIGSAKHPEMRNGERRTENEERGFAYFFFPDPLDGAGGAGAGFGAGGETFGAAGGACVLAGGGVIFGAGGAGFGAGGGAVTRGVGGGACNFWGAG